MKKSWLISLIGATCALTAAVFVLAGCGGGGGPITLPQPPTPSSVTEQFRALWPQGTDATYVGDAKCLSCHSGKSVHLARSRQEGAPQINLTDWNGTRHAQIGVGCEQCHGPGSKHIAAQDEEKSGLILSALNVINPDDPDKRKVVSVTNPVVCGQCHGPIYTDYLASHHADLVEEEGAVGPAQNGSKTCLRCHNGQFRADLIDNTIDNGSGGPSYQRIASIETAIGALSAGQMTTYGDAALNSATCVDCHDPMRATKVKLDENGRDLQLLRSTFNTDTSNYPPSSAPSSVKPGDVGHLTTFNHTCGVCHAAGTSTGGDGRDAKLQTTTSRDSFHENPQYAMLMGAVGSEWITDSNGNPLNQPPAQRNTAHATGVGGPWDQCVHCHMPNGSHTWTVKLDVSCAPCHTPDDAQARLAVQGLIQNGLAALRTRLSNWAKANLGDPDMWDYTAYIQEEGKTPPTAEQEAAIPIEVKRARHNYHFILKDRSYGVHNRVYAQYLLDIANRNLDHLGIPRSATIRLSPAQVKAILNADLLKSRRAAAQPDL
jgi:hypothetical protein